MDKQLLQYEGMKKLLGAFAILTFLQGVSILLQAIMLAEVVTHLFHSGKWQEMYFETLLFALSFLARHGLHHIKQKLAERYADNIGTKLRAEVLDNLFHQGPRIAKQLGTGSIVTLLLEGVSHFKQYLVLFTPKLMNMAIIPGMVVIYIGVQDRTSAIILLVTLPILIAFMILLGWAAQKKADKQWSMYRVLSNHFVDSLRGLETLKYLGLSKFHSKNIEAVSSRYRKTTMGTLKFAFLSSFAMDFFTMLSVATVAVFLGLRLVEGDMLLLPALTILILAPEYFLPIREIGSDYHASLNGQEAGKKLREIAAIPRFRTEERSPISDWSRQSCIRLTSATVQHDPKGQPSLKDVSLSVSGYQKIGIVGESGAGKSTLIDLIGGFAETHSGNIEINGQSFSHLQRKEWQKQLNYIPQQPYLFQGSILQNIAFYRPDAALEEVQWAAEQAGLSELLKECPDGLHEKIGEGGRSLSGGQAQRVAIARAFLEDRPLLLLDEPTAHLDIETEYDLKKRFLALFQDKLVFLATHRLHWMKEMDYIYFLKHGTIIEEGTHEELMKKKGPYCEMVKIQMGDET
ncbi:thiol reductant ABC exporter subunit CydD [Bacillus xiapuensis]|uniref:thiol reductant ABC exporter subunit CydD n=1 Tax=Bacillus xiapuensis TaxID=2014075 RepID=UPI000C24E86A|nr:thiol reductant ABC exporter subunit CydD [Bacillus xiapuensis]